MSISNYFYCDPAGREIGPLPLPALAQLRQAGVLTDETLVRAENETAWTECRNVIAAGPAVQASTLIGIAPRTGGWRFKKSHAKIAGGTAAGLLFLAGLYLAPIGYRMLAPSQTDGENAINAKIQDEAQGRISVVEFAKTEVQAREVNGVKVHRLEYALTIEFSEDCNWLHDDTLGLSFRTDLTPADRGSNQIGTSTMSAGLGERVHRLGRRKLTGFIDFTRRGTGWGVSAPLPAPVSISEVPPRVESAQEMQLSEQKIQLRKLQEAANEAVRNSEVAKKDAERAQKELERLQSPPNSTKMFSGSEVVPPTPRDHFNDYAGIVQPDIARTLDDELTQFEQTTSNQLVVAIYPHMQSNSSIEDYTLRVARAWGVGQRDRNNGAVLFIFSQDRKLTLQVGYGLESALPNALCKQIIENEITPRFRNGDFTGGVSAGVHAVIAAVRGEHRGTGSAGDTTLEKRTSPEPGQAWTVPDLNLEMVFIRPGTFTMGSPVTEQGRNDGEIQHTLILTKGFWLGKTVVTQGQWEAVMGGNPSNFKNAGRDAPVEQVSWDDAMQFCRKLTDRERQAGRLPEGHEYTLPTEAQWEYACRAGTTGPFAGNGDLDSMGWYNQNSGNTTHPVAQKQPNAWGLYDMHGNVWEWCRDWYGHYPGGSVTDPTGPSSGSQRVLRGGGWNADARNCRSASRDWYSPVYRSYTLGFRLALSSVR